MGISENYERKTGGEVVERGEEVDIGVGQGRFLSSFFLNNSLPLLLSFVVKWIFDSIAIVFHGGLCINEMKMGVLTII